MTFMRTHLFSPVSPTSAVCGLVENRSACRQARDAEVHLVDEPRCFSYYPQVQVRVTTGGEVGVHFCQVAWDRQPDGWFAAWYEPHNKPSKWFRAPKLDSQSARGIGEMTYVLVACEPTNDDLTDLGLNFD